MARASAPRRFKRSACSSTSASSTRTSIRPSARARSSISSRNSLGNDRPGPDEFWVEEALGHEALRPADFQNVAEAARRQNRGARAFAFQNRVGAHGGAVRDSLDGGEVEILDSLEKNRVFFPPKRGNLGNLNPLLVFIVENEVGKGSSGVYADKTQRNGLPFIFI